MSGNGALRRFEGRLALVTGAGGPMGGAVAARLAAEGADLLIADISERRLTSVAEAIRAQSPRQKVIAFRANVLIEEEVKSLLARIDDRCVHVLANIVGGIRGAQLSIGMAEIGEERWDDTFSLNLKGIFHLVRRLGPAMKNAGYGRIVNIASISYGGDSERPDYAAAKAAVASLTRSLAAEYAPQVTVNCISPGIIKTSIAEHVRDEFIRAIAERSLLKRVGRPEDIAAAVAFLGSDDAAYITGAILPVSGGIWVNL